MSTSKADLRIIDLNDAMNLVQKEFDKTGSIRLQEALILLGRVKSSLIQNLDHDRSRKKISYPLSVTSAPYQQPPVLPLPEHPGNRPKISDKR